VCACGCCQRTSCCREYLFAHHAPPSLSFDARCNFLGETAWETLHCFRFFLASGKCIRDACFEWKRALMNFLYTYLHTHTPAGVHTHTHIHTHTGGLGKYMVDDEYENWLCSDEHICASNGDYMCFVWLLPPSVL